VRRVFLGAIRFDTVIALAVGGLHLIAPGSAAAASAVTIQGAAGCAGSAFCYVPPSVTTSSGDTVTWTNQSGVAHTVTRCDPANCNGTGAGTGTDPSFDLAVAGANGTAVSQTFTGAGTYNYYCKIHGFSTMHGTITVQGQTTATTGSGATSTTSAPAPTAAGTVASAPPPKATTAQPVDATPSLTG
jgi:plastocyanin